MRHRDPSRLDRIVDAASQVFATVGLGRARVSQIAARAGSSAGSIYLYAKDKDALFELAVLRACESPSVALVELPYQGAGGQGWIASLEAAVEAIVHFPLLWLAAQRRTIDDGLAEYHGILLELARWTSRYRRALLLAHASRAERPEVAAAFDRLVWTDLSNRLAAYLGSRMRTGHLPVVGEPALAARVTLDALAGSMLGNPVRQAAADQAAAEVLSRLLVPGLLQGS